MTETGYHYSTCGAPTANGGHHHHHHHLPNCWRPRDTIRIYSGPSYQGKGCCVLQNEVRIFSNKIL